MIVHNCEQYTPEYWQLRCGVITASELHRIITPAKWEYAAGADSYAVELIAQLYDHDYGMVSEFATAAMKNGHIFEPRARAFYELERGCDVQRVGFITTDDGRFGCSPDGLVGDDGGVELKHPTVQTHIKWLLAGTVPKEHLAQCYGSMLVTQRKWWDFLSVYDGLPPLLLRVEPDDKMLKLAEAMERFWKTYTELRARIEGGREELIAAAVAANGEPQAAYF